MKFSIALQSQGSWIVVMDLAPKMTPNQAIDALVTETNNVLDPAYHVNADEYTKHDLAYAIIDEELRAMPLSVASAGKFGNTAIETVFKVWFDTLAGLNPDKGQIVTW